MDKKLSALGGFPLTLHQGVAGTLPLDPAGGSFLGPCYRLALCSLTMVYPHLANPGSVPDIGQEENKKRMKTKVNEAR